MELDRAILEKICYDEHNSGSEHPAPVSLLHYEIAIDGIVWVARCVYSYSVPMNVNGAFGEGWKPGNHVAYKGTAFVGNMQYKREKARSIREKKLDELGI